VATLLKLHVGLILPFLVVRRRWATTVAYGAGLGLIAATSLVIAPELSLDYVQRQLPRISVFGEWGTDEMMLPPEQLEALLVGVPEGMTRLTGAVGTGTLITMREYFPFIANGTLVREYIGIVERWGLTLSISQLSMGLYALLFGAFCVWQWRNRAIFARLDRRRYQSEAPGEAERGDVGPDTRDTAEFLYWALALIIIMMTAPATWVMNLVWLLPLGVVFAAEARRLTAEPPALWPSAALLVVWSAGLALAAVPDRIIGLWEPAFAYRIPDSTLFPWGWLWASRKYIVAQGLLLVSIAPYVAVTFTSRARGSRREKA
jgi:hypothetical protein